MMMNRRKKLIAAAVCVLALTALLVLPARLLSLGAHHAGDRDAEHMIGPMLSLLDKSPAETAHTPVSDMMDIEDVWAIEDTREERFEAPLVAGMRNGDSELGYDAESNTFYCTVGLDGEDWPALQLFAAPAEGTENLGVTWIDDYSYDFMSDAVSEGYRYELMAYTDTEYAYFGIVFTGLPTVTLHVDGGKEALCDEYIPARMSVSSAEHEAISSGAWVHLRGGGFEKARPKWSFRVEFHEVTGRGDKKTARSVLGMPADTDWLLISNASDESCVRNEISWDLWRDWNEDDHAFMLLESRMVEVFLEDEYMGVYQVMQRINEEEEIVRMGGSLASDYTARVVKKENLGKRPNIDWMEEAGFYGELRQAPQGVSAASAFDRFAPYIAMSAQPKKYISDEEFTALCEKHVDVREMLEYFLFVQAASLGHDNYFNNVYMWALWNGENHVYHLSPWDMDASFIRMFGNGDQDTINLLYTLCTRMVELDIGGARGMLWEIWNDKRNTVITDDAMYNRLLEQEELLNRSGAYLRETEKWFGEARTLDLTEMQVFALEHLRVADFMMSELFPHENAVY